LDRDAFVDCFDKFWRIVDRADKFKELYAYATRFDDSNARYMLSRLEDCYRMFPEVIKLRIYAPHEVPDGLLA
jgi:hypothetical protein